MHSIARVLLRARRFVVRATIWKYPSFYLPIVRLSGRRRKVVVGRNTELVIEGFPRSGNTFAVAAFTVAQGRSVVLGPHLHAPAQVIAAARRGIPAVVLIRRPADAVLSLVIRQPDISVEEALNDYIRFYTAIMPYGHAYVVATFEDITGDFGKVVDGINARFSTEFKVFEHTDENLKACFELVEQMDQQDRGQAKVNETTVARPSEYRQEMKGSLAQELESGEARTLLARAEEIYREFGQVIQNGPDTSRGPYRTAC